jgi:hypothetical protein
MTALSIRAYFEPKSEERPDLVEQYLFTQEKVRQFEIAREGRRIRFLIYCLLIGALSAPVVSSWILQAVEGKQCERNPIVCQM